VLYVITKLISRDSSEQESTWARMPPDATTIVIIRVILSIDDVSVDLYASTIVYCKLGGKYSVFFVGNRRDWLGMKGI
jgi:hypothetical protein